VNPQAAIAGATMAYRQAKPAARAAIISYLKELH
jgi:cytochrome c2